MSRVILRGLRGGEEAKGGRAKHSRGEDQDCANNSHQLSSSSKPPENNHAPAM